MLYRPSEIIKDAAVLRELGRIAQAFQLLATNNIRVLAVAPEKPRDGDAAICDGVNWNPLGDGIKRPVWFNALTQTWNRFD